LIAGTPCTGKTTIAKRLAEVLEATYIDVAKLIEEEELYSSIDVERRSLIVNVERAKKFFAHYLREEERVVLDTHVVEIFPRRLITKVIVLRLHPVLLLKRCLDRGWSLEKSIENALAELLNTCLVDAINVYGEGKVWDVDCTCCGVEEVLRRVLAAVSGSRGRDSIDWLERLEGRPELELLLKLEEARYLVKDLLKLLGYCR